MTTSGKNMLAKSEMARSPVERARMKAIAYTKHPELRKSKPKKVRRY